MIDTYLFGNYEYKAENTQYSRNETGHEMVRVTTKDLYTPERGYGFVTEMNRRKYKMLQYSELNSGFEPIYWLQDSQTLALQDCSQGIKCEQNFYDVRRRHLRNSKFHTGRKRKACFLHDLDCGLAKPSHVYKCEQNFYDNKSIDVMQNMTAYYLPILFKATVNSKGNYKITVNIQNLDDQASEFMIFAGRRHLAYKGTIDGKNSYTSEFVVNLSDIIPRTTTERMVDLTIDVAVVGENTCLSYVQIQHIDCPTLYLLGDSTVTDQSADYPYAPETSYAGWGQMLSAYLLEKIAISNHAHSGLTIESFRSEGHLAIVYDSIRPGDYCMIQFGHNDQKLMHLKAEGGYRQRIEDLIDELKRKGVKPMLVTPMARNSWRGKDGTYNDLLFDYGRECIRIGKSKQIPVIDLHKRSMDFVLDKGLTDAKPYFFPNDFTHTNDIGAYRMARFVASEILENGDMQIRGVIQARGMGEWEPRSDIKQLEIPELLEGTKNTPKRDKLFQTLERAEEDCKRAECLYLMIQAARFFPTNVYNDHFKDVVGHEWYAGIIECACQNGIIENDMVLDGCIRPEESVTMKEVMAFAVNVYMSRKGKRIDFIETGIVTKEEQQLLMVSRGRIARLCGDMKL